MPEINEKVFDAIRNGRLRHDEPLNGTNDGRLFSMNGTSVSAQSYAINSTKKFWVQKADETYEEISATLRANGTRCNVWVRDKNYSSGSVSEKDNRITSKQAEDMAKKFDDIYDLETPVFGYEYGGGVQANDETYGGIDHDPAIQILVYDIYNDYSPNQTGGVLGYFFSGDEFLQKDMDSAKLNIKSNQAEMFYIDAYFTDSHPDTIYSTLAHEFQHMINFNRKTMSNTNTDQVSAVWFNEMLSMVAEDLIDPLIGIGIENDAHPVNTRMPLFLSSYNYADPTVWLDGNDVLKSYSNAYALGAYLVRNFGGAAFVKSVMDNNYVDALSIDVALNSDVNPHKDTIVRSTQALSRFGEAMLFDLPQGQRSAGVFSFNNMATHKINGKDYTFFGFDIYEIKNGYKAGNGDPLTGPLVWDTGKTYSLKPRTMILQTNDDWQGISGKLSITLRPPAVSGVDMYIIVR
jgi:hypothetical protein